MSSAAGSDWTLLCRCNLSSVLLQLLALGVRDVLSFDFMDKPSADQLSDAFQQLVLLGAVDAHTKKVSL